MSSWKYALPHSLLDIIKKLLDLMFSVVVLYTCTWYASTNVHNKFFQPTDNAQFFIFMKRWAKTWNIEYEK